MAPKRATSATAGPRRSTRTTHAPELFSESEMSVATKAPASKRTVTAETASTTTKKGRGKTASTTTKSKASTKTVKATTTVDTPRSKGRPKKSAATTKASTSRVTKTASQPSRVTKTTAKPTSSTSRSRGRPKKSETVAAAVPVKANAQATTSHRGGRAKQSEAANDVEMSEEAPASKTTSRGRGRPARNEVITVEVPTEPATTASTSTRPKRAPVSRKSPQTGPGTDINTYSRAVKTRPTASLEAGSRGQSSKRKAEDEPETDVKPVPKAKKPKTKPAEAPELPTVPFVPLQAPTDELTVFFAGVGENGELGMGTDKKAGMNAKRPRLNKLLEDAHVVQIAPAAMHCVALTLDNRILTWGVNDQGALGRNTDWEGGLKDMDNGESSDSDSEDGDSGLNPKEATPAAIPTSSFPPGTTFAKVTASDSASFALTTDGKVYGWGTFRDANGILGFLGDGDAQRSPVLIEGLSNITSIVCGNNHVIALNADGTAFSFGAGQQNQLGRDVPNDERFEALKPHEFGLPKGEIASIHAGSEHSFAFGKDGRIWAWGLNNFGQCGMETPSGQQTATIPKPTLCTSLQDQNIADIRGGAFHSVAVTADGNILVWGRADGGQLGIDLSTIPEANVARAESTNKIGLVKAPVLVSSLPKHEMAYAATATDHTIAITKDGHAYSWGFSTLYQTGLGTDDDVNIATLIDNTAVRNKKLNWAGCGGQFSVFTCLSGAQGEREPVTAKPATNGHITKRETSVEASAVEHTPIVTPAVATAPSPGSGPWVVSPMPTLPPSTPDYQSTVDNPNSATTANHRGHFLSPTPAVETHLQSPAVEALRNSTQQRAPTPSGTTPKPFQPTTFQQRAAYGGFIPGRTIGFDSPADISMMDGDRSLISTATPTVTKDKQQQTSSHDLFNGSVVSETE